MFGFDKLAGFEKKICQKIQRNLVVKSLSLMLSFMALQIKEKLIDKDKIEAAQGSGFYNDLLEIKDNIKLHRKIFGYFDRYFQVNEVLSKHNFFLNFFE